MVSYETLEEWSQSGKSDYDVVTYHRFKELIEAHFPDAEVYLQGSYRNSTNLFDDSDIDIVVECEGYSEYGINGRNLRYLRDDMYEELNGCGNINLALGNKTIKYAGSRKYDPVDIVPSIPYVNWNTRGISIYDHRNHKVIHNYPKQHIRNGEQKSKRTYGAFKQAVRMFKSARNYLEEEGLIKSGSAPSYFIECMLYNVPDDCFDGYPPYSFFGITEWLAKNKWSLRFAKCQNGITDLFASGEGWDFNKYLAFVNALQRL